MMRVLVTGSRSWKDKEAALIRSGASLVIHGGALGADSLADEVARELKIPRKIYRAEWEKYGKAAGSIRNGFMLHDSQPDIVLAFWDGKSPGTRDMIAKAKRYGVEVWTCFADLTEIGVKR